MNVCRLLWVVATVALVNGCTPTSTNLTPRNVARTPSDVYHFETQWETSRRGVSGSDVQAYVVIRDTMYPMKRVAGTVDRWEADVPVPPSQTVIPYQFKYDYTYPTLTKRKVSSDLSPQYFLDLSKPVPQFVPPGQ
ncbi:MAG TPA: hypothetical protein PLX89_17905 [Verrucomicrobiota bacterium]|nr:hypothetical protein [Verrucomicrobiales bacterium]HRI14875.1 hypothetical protein [Verrucomicrobiota bacterium]